MVDPTGTNLPNPGSVGAGGTGTSTLTAHAVVVGEGTAAVAEVGPGTAGFLLQSSGASADPVWVGGLSLLNTLSPNGVATTNDTTSLTSTYANYMVAFENVAPSNATVAGFNMTVATTGTTFVTAGYYSQVASLGATLASTLSTSTAAFLLSSAVSTAAPTGTSAAMGVSGFVTIMNAAGGASYKQIVGQTCWLTTTGGATAFWAGNIAGTFQVVSPVIGVQFQFASGNIATGVIKIYGIN